MCPSVSGPSAAIPTTRPSSSATQRSWSRGTISVMNRRCSSSVWRSGRNVSVPREATNVSAIPWWSPGSEALAAGKKAARRERKSFGVRGETEAAAQLHVARTVARRAELAALEADVNPLARVYLNRVSDLLFIPARAANALAGGDEPLWRPGG